MRYEFPLKSVFDPKIAAWMLNPDGLKEDFEFLALVSRIGKRSYLQSQNNIHTKLKLTWNVYEFLWDSIRRNRMEVCLVEQEMPISQLLGEMQAIGVGFDNSRLKNHRNDIDSKMQDIENEIWKLAGKKFMITSPEQVSEVLFEKLKLPYPSNSGNLSKGQYSTSVIFEHFD
jgi:DNA polymerase-1